MPKYLRVDCSVNSGKGLIGGMTGIQVEIADGEDFEIAKAKALGFIVQELSRYGLHEALSCLGISPRNEAVVLVNGTQYKPVS